MSTATSTLDEQWYYIDSQGIKQGPFLSEELEEWCTEGYFTPENLFRSASLADDQDFKPLSLLRPSFATSILPEESPQEPMDEASVSSIPSAEPEFVESNESQWLYLDTDNLIRGPYPELAVRFWALTEQFPSESLIYRFEGQYPDRSLFKSFSSHSEFATASSPYVSTMDIPEYFYIDEHVAEQGPFTEEVVFSWLKNGLFNGNEHLVTYGPKPRQFGMVKDIDPFKRFFVEADAPIISSLPPLIELLSHRHSLVWHYEDENQCIQGPFTSQQMTSWVDAGWLPNTLRVNPKIDSDEPSALDDFVPLLNVRDVLKKTVSTTAGVPSDDGKTGKHTQMFSYRNYEGLAFGPFSAAEMSRFGELGRLAPDFTFKEARESKWSPPSTYSFNASICDEWYYMDSENTQQGPFTVKQMRQWFMGGYFSTDLLIRAGSVETFHSLSSMFLPGFALFSAFQSIISIADTGLDPSASWFWTDTKGIEQGPFTTQRMREFWKSRHLEFTTLLRVSTEPESTALLARNDVMFLNIPELSIAPMSIGPSIRSIKPVDQETYQVSASFNSRTGRFESGVGTGTHWERQGKASDPEGRQMERYIDLSALGTAPERPTKKSRARK